MKPTPTPIAEIIAANVQSVCDWDDRTSPDDYPDHLLITPAELTELLEGVVDAALSVQGEPVAWRYSFDEGVTWNHSGSRPGNHRFGGPDIVEPLYAAPSAPEGWQPIETAPKDGTKILAWSGFWEKHHLVRWNQGENAWCEGSWCFGSVPDMVWMPLPAPPAAGDKP